MVMRRWSGSLSNLLMISRSLSRPTNSPTMLMPARILRGFFTKSLSVKVELYTAGKQGFLLAMDEIILILLVEVYFSYLKAKATNRRGKQQGRRRRQRC